MKLRYGVAVKCEHLAYSAQVPESNQVSSENHGAFEFTLV